MASAWLSNENSRHLFVLFGLDESLANLQRAHLLVEVEREAMRMVGVCMHEAWTCSEINWQRGCTGARVDPLAALITENSESNNSGHNN